MSVNVHVFVSGQGQGVEKAENARLVPLFVFGLNDAIHLTKWKLHRGTFPSSLKSYVECYMLKGNKVCGQ